MNDKLDGEVPCSLSLAMQRAVASTSPTRYSATAPSISCSYPDSFRTWRIWRSEPSHARWLHRLGQSARVIMFDKRGTGLSDRVDHQPGMDARMDDVRAVMDAVGVERAAIMGVSEAGSLASLFAATHPERCQALILYGAFARFSSWFPTEEALQRFY